MQVKTQYLYLSLSFFKECMCSIESDTQAFITLNHKEYVTSCHRHFVRSLAESILVSSQRASFALQPHAMVPRERGIGQLCMCQWASLQPIVSHKPHWRL